jgi:fructokinase
MASRKFQGGGPGHVDCRIRERICDVARKKHTVIGLGELLWDLFPSGKKLGGAPANFAYITSLLGDYGIAASRIGQDHLGEEAILRLTELGLPASFIQDDADHATGTVKVEVDDRGQPRFQIAESVAWDFLEWTPQWQILAEQADAVCFGSLAQRSPRSRSSIRNFLQATRAEAVHVFDVNLRQNFYNAEILSDSLKLATIVKLNHEELPKIAQILGLNNLGMNHLPLGQEDEESSARLLLTRYNLKLICITRGDRGSLLLTAQGRHEHAGVRVKVADTVGAGDAFTAALVHEYLCGASLESMNEVANRMGAWVASEVGATPVLKPGGLEKTLAGIC